MVIQELAKSGGHMPCVSSDMCLELEEQDSTCLLTP